MCSTQSVHSVQGMTWAAMRSTHDVTRDRGPYDARYAVQCGHSVPSVDSVTCCSMIKNRCDVMRHMRDVMTCMLCRMHVCNAPWQPVEAARNLRCMRAVQRGHSVLSVSSVTCSSVCTDRCVRPRHTCDVDVCVRDASWQPVAAARNLQCVRAVS